MLMLLQIRRLTGTDRSRKPGGNGITMPHRNSGYCSILLTFQEN